MKKAKAESCASRLLSVKMPFTAATSGSISEVMKPQAKNSVVTAMNAARTVALFSIGPPRPEMVPGLEHRRAMAIEMVALPSRGPPAAKLPFAARWANGRAMNDLPPPNDHAALAHAAQGEAALCTIVGIDGSFSRRAGTQLAVDADG